MILKIIDCVQCKTFLGFITDVGLVVENLLIKNEVLFSKENDNVICCADCGKDIVDSIKN